MNESITLSVIESKSMMATEGASESMTYIIETKSTTVTCLAFQLHSDQLCEHERQHHRCSFFASNGDPLFVRSFGCLGVVRVVAVIYGLVKLRKCIMSNLEHL